MSDPASEPDASTTTRTAAQSAPVNSAQATVSISHFGASFEKSWRENDYLWGRLDAAELAFRLLSRQSGGKQDLTEYLRSALTAILAAEKQDLTLVDKISRALAAQVAAIKPGAVPGPG